MNRQFEYHITRMLQQIKAWLRMQPLNLGGASGNNGGNGGPPGGIIGQLSQLKVAFDTSELASNTIPASGESLLDNLNRIRYRISNIEDGNKISIEDSGVLLASGISVLNFAGEVDLVQNSVDKITITVLGASGSGARGESFTWYIDGTIASKTNISAEYYANVPDTIETIAVSVKEGGTGTLSLDINSDGTSILSAPISLSLTGGASTSLVNNVNATINQGSVITLDLDSVPTGAENLTVTVFLASGSGGTVGGSGDMLKAVYDTNNNGIVDNSEKLEGNSSSYFATSTHNHDGTYSPIAHTHGGEEGGGNIICDNFASLPPPETNNGAYFLSKDGVHSAFSDGLDWLYFGPLFRTTPPPYDGWIADNIGASEVSYSTGSIILDSLQTDGIAALYRDRPGPTYSITAAFYVSPYLQPNSGGGICFREDESGYYHACVIKFDSSMKRYIYSMRYRGATDTEPSAYTSNEFSWYGSNIYWLRMIDNGTMRKFQYSMDGLLFRGFHDVSSIDFLQADEVGIVSTYAGGVNLISWEIGEA